MDQSASWTSRDPQRLCQGCHPNRPDWSASMVITEVVCTWSSRCDFSLWSLPLLHLHCFILCNIASCEGLGITFGPFPLDSHPLIRIVGRILRSNLEMVVLVLLSVFLDYSINKYAHHQLLKDFFSSLVGIGSWWMASDNHFFFHPFYDINWHSWALVLRESWRWMTWANTGRHWDWRDSDWTIFSSWFPWRQQLRRSRKDRRPLSTGTNSWHWQPDNLAMYT